MSDARVHHILFVSYGTHQSCSLYAEAPNVWIFHFHTVFIMKRLLKCRQILIWKAAASSRHTHAHRHRPTKNSCVAEEGRDRQHHSPTTRRLLGGYEAGSVFTTSAATKSSVFSMSSFSSATPSHQHSANTNKQHTRRQHSANTNKQHQQTTPSHQHSANTNKQPQAVNTVQTLTNNPKPSTLCKH